MNTPNVRVTSQSTGTADQTAENRLLERERLFRRIETLYGIPWYFLAAIDQFERNVRNSRRDLPDVPHEQLLAVQLPTEQWVGLLNPLKDDTDPHTIRFFGGIGADGDGDGLAQRESETDALYALILYLQTYGVDWLSLRTAVWDLYKHPSAVDTVSHIATIYRAMQTMNVQENHFPVSLRHNYTYRSTWGATRGWGGRRIHEGTDIFAHHGTPVYSTCYGYVEAKGWNKYGGWRLGIRDVHNNYHYFAHLGSFDKAIRVGKVVRPGELIGYVGNSGYGPPGTAGKFPPHLHYGMYKFNGKTEWSFDPYPYLRVWEKETRQKKRTQQYQ
ncbi:M23 family metallopeptidase [Numidum massiliense]|uniref:M23 family metallopeptidase n=1 Tax=Numidum massiliense TaxID=1522315 RepID=UPI0006D58E43|nr:M23 family metallopeptidase [Numidum massiliense]